MLQTLYGKLRTNAIMYVKLTLARARCKLVCMSCEKKKTIYIHPISKYDSYVTHRQLHLLQSATHVLALALKAANFVNWFCVTVPANVSINLVQVSLFVRLRLICGIANVLASCKC